MRSIPRRLRRSHVNPPQYIFKSDTPLTFAEADRIKAGFKAAGMSRGIIYYGGDLTVLA